MNEHETVLAETDSTGFGILPSEQVSAGALDELPASSLSRYTRHALYACQLATDCTAAR
jgi:hypothetical protein